MRKIVLYSILYGLLPFFGETFLQKSNTLNKGDKRGMSGHSKFANIKHKKEKNDAKKGKIFTIIAVRS